ncbi:Hypothetical_protein [Hexamita inflata]|uniref:Hypothetical_protein n=1 Tax=Hexamita inflata TaxID=28002 RepID=A0AA86QV62_9EUKA|nr:Hypothetical protein HINF_LOCUS49012 [Hexamita inflata]
MSDTFLCLPENCFMLWSALRRFCAAVLAPKVDLLRQRLLAVQKRRNCCQSGTTSNRTDPTQISLGSGIEAAAVLQRVRFAVQWQVFALKCSHVARRVRGSGLPRHKTPSPPFWDLSSCSGVCSIWAEKTASERPKALEWGIPNGGICAQLLRSESNHEKSGVTDVFVELSDSEQNKGAKEREPEAVSCWMLKMHSNAALNQFNDE